MGSISEFFEYLGTHMRMIFVRDLAPQSVPIWRLTRVRAINGQLTRNIAAAILIALDTAGTVCAFHGRDRWPRSAASPATPASTISWRSIRRG